MVTRIGTVAKGRAGRVTVYEARRRWISREVASITSRDAAVGMRRPNLRFVYAQPAHWIAFGGGIGLVPWAPGTAGTLLAWIAFDLVITQVTVVAGAVVAGVLVLTAAFIVGVWACDRAGRALSAPDHGGMVWDEMVAFWLVLAVLPMAWTWQAAGFVLFRLFDITKPPPIRQADRLIKGGFGVMLDDLLAAAYTVLVIIAAVFCAQRFGWSAA